VFVNGVLQVVKDDRLEDLSEMGSSLFGVDGRSDGEGGGNSVVGGEGHSRGRGMEVRVNQRRWWASWYSIRISRAFLKLLGGCQVLSLMGYPLPHVLWFVIASILYSSSPSIRSEGGFIKLGPWVLVSR